MPLYDQPPKPLHIVLRERRQPLFVGGDMVYGASGAGTVFKAGSVWESSRGVDQAPPGREADGSLTDRARQVLMEAQVAALAARSRDPDAFAIVAGAVRILATGEGDQAWACSVLDLPPDWASGGQLRKPQRGSALSALMARGTLGKGGVARRRFFTAVTYEGARETLARASGAGYATSPLGRMIGGTGRTNPACDGEVAMMIALRERSARDLCRSMEARLAREADGRQLLRVVERVVIDGAALSAAVEDLGFARPDMAGGRKLRRALDVMGVDG
jgi:hypothetical protein